MLSESQNPTRAAVELFHLALLRVLTTGPSAARLALKGGCNLRFFFGSPRYSEDMDLDCKGIAVNTLRGSVDKALESDLLRRPLRARGIEVTDISRPKQTEAAQRWKLGLVVRGVGAPVRTKVEFSHRAELEGARTDAVDAQLAREYQLPALVFQHYPAEQAVIQKVHALAGRPQTQARDVFDLALLLSSPKLSTVPDIDAAVLRKATARALDVSFSEFTSQVRAYLPQTVQDSYATAGAWEQLQLEVTSWLEARLR